MEHKLGAIILKGTQVKSALLGSETYAGHQAIGEIAKLENRDLTPKHARADELRASEMDTVSASLGAKPVTLVRNSDMEMNMTRLPV